MPFVGSPLQPEILRLVVRARRRLWLVAPFVKRNALDRLISALPGRRIDLRLITRLSEQDFVAGVSDVAALRRFVECGGSLKVHDQSLHAKVMVADDEAVVGSANLTDGGLIRNIEAGIRDGADLVSAWFQSLWESAAHVSAEDLSRVEAEVQRKATIIERTRPTVVFKDFAALLRDSMSRRQGGNAIGYWLKLNGFSGAGKRERFDARPSDYARADCAQCFSKVPRMRAGDAVYLLNMITTRDGKPARVLYGRGYVDVAHRPQIDVMPDRLRNGCGALPTEVRQWPLIVWLRDVELLNCVYGDAPNPYVPHGKAPPALNMLSTRQGSHFRLSSDQAAALDELLDDASRRYPIIRLPINGEIWWNRYLAPEQHLTRQLLETNSDRR